MQFNLVETIANSIHENQVVRNTNQRVLRVAKKKILVDELGGVCEICGYNKNLAAFTFHHKNRKEKEMNLSRMSGRCLNRQRKEASVCRLLCANCHAELHHPDLDKDVLWG